MVEFGIKLQDNQVTEWSEYYLKYEQLQQILAQCAAAVARYEAARKRAMPISRQDVHAAGLSTRQACLTDNRGVTKQIIQQTTQAFGQGLATSFTFSQDSAVDDMILVPTPTAIDTTTDYNGTATETTPIKSFSSSSALSIALERVTSGMAHHFQQVYQRQERDAILDIDKYSEQFEKALMQDLDTVNTFYNDKLQELTHRLALLQESVAQLRTAWGDPVPPPPIQKEEDQEHDEEEETDYFDLETPLICEQRKTYRQKVQGFAQNMAQRFGMEDTHLCVSQGTVLSSWAGHDDDKDVDHDGTARSITFVKQQRNKEIQSIQRDLLDLYRTAKLLYNFAIMNYTGFVKIVKKHEILKQEKDKYQQAIRPENVCHVGKSVEQLANQMEKLYAHWFCNGNVSEAQAQMLPKKGDGLDWFQTRLGYRMGMCSMLGLWVSWDCLWGQVVHGNTTTMDDSSTPFPVFRACGGLLIWQWCWGCSVWLWTRYRINYIYIMDLDPSTVQSPLAIFNQAVDDTLVYLLCTLLYYKARVHEIPGDFPAGIFLAFVILYTIYRLIFPLWTRLPMWDTIWEVITSPLYSPTFFHTYVGEIFTSLVKVFQDMAWSVCFLLSGDFLISDGSKLPTRVWSHTAWYSQVLIPLLTWLPLWFRFNQCLRRYIDTGKRFPYLANALKYALVQTVTLFGAFHPLHMQGKTGISVMFQLCWASAFVVSSLYSFAWDVYMDWGLGRPEYAFLGPRLMYPRQSAFYITIGVDLVLRFGWVLTLIPPDSGAKFTLPSYLTAVSIMLELFRRTAWGFLRLENEHRSNTAGYRRVDFVPLHFTTGHARANRERKTVDHHE